MDGCSDEVFYAEIAKCVLVCKAHHLERHKQMRMVRERIAERTISEQSSLNTSDDAADTAA